MGEDEVLEEEKDWLQTQGVAARTSHSLNPRQGTLAVLRGIKRRKKEQKNVSEGFSQ